MLLMESCFIAGLLEAVVVIGLARVLGTFRARAEQSLAMLMVCLGIWLLNFALWAEEDFIFTARVRCLVFITLLFTLASVWLQPALAEEDQEAPY